MTDIATITDDPRVQQALNELQELISVHYPIATFTAAHGDDPEGMDLMVHVDVADIDEVVDVFIARLVEMQVDDELPIYAIPVEPPARVAAEPVRRTRLEAYSATVSAAC